MKQDHFENRETFFNAMDHILLFLLVIGYAYFFIYTIEWVEIIGHDFADMRNYLERIEYLRRGLPEREFSGIGLIFSEYLWKFITIMIGLFFDDHRAGLYLVSFTSLSLYTFFTFRRVNIVLAAALLLTPMFVDLILGQVRMSLAFPTLLMAYELRTKKISFLILVIAVFIHTGTLIFIGTYFILKYIENRFEPEKLYQYSMLWAFIMVIIMKYGIDIILIAVGSPKADYASLIEASSISYSLPWFILALILVFKASYETMEERMIIAFSVTMMSFFLFASVFGVYGQRYVAVSIPLIIISLSYLPRHYKQGTILALILYQFLQYKYWFSMTLV
jgi:hypothetical protein